MYVKRNKKHIDSTLCYLERDGKFLMLYRNMKKNDPCEGKWVGIGGKFEAGETKEDCLVREVYEETGYTLTSFESRGVVHFESDELPDEDMYLFTANLSNIDSNISPLFETDPEGHVLSSHQLCNEGELSWIPKEKVLSLNLWEGDKYFLEPLIAGNDNIEIICTYEGDKLVNSEIISL